MGTLRGIQRSQPASSRSVLSMGLQTRLLLPSWAVQLPPAGGGSPRGRLLWKEPGRTGSEPLRISLLPGCVGDRPSASAACGCHNQAPPAWWLQTTGFYSLGSGGQRPKSACLQGRRLQGRALPCLFPGLVAASSPWGSLACGHITPTSASTATGPPPLGVSVSKFPSYKDTSHRMRASLIHMTSS